MAESLVQVTEGSGKKLHTWQRTIGANNVEDEFTLPGEYPMATYSVTLPGISCATANDHLLTLNAGASLNVYVRRVRIEQQANAAAAKTDRFQLLRTTTTTPTGGTAVTPGAFDTTDAAAGATSRSIPGVKGTETTEFASTILILRQAILATATQPEELYEWTALPNMKGIRIPAGVLNGFCVKHTTADASATVIVTIDFVEANY